MALLSKRGQKRRESEAKAETQTEQIEAMIARTAAPSDAVSTRQMAEYMALLNRASTPNLVYTPNTATREQVAFGRWGQSPFISFDEAADVSKVAYQWWDGSGNSRPANTPKPLGPKPSLSRVSLDDIVDAASKAGNDEEARLAKDAADLLGYSGLSDDIKKRTAKADALAGLKRAGVAPFVQGDVDAYKAWKVNEANGKPRKDEWFRRGFAWAPCALGGEGGRQPSAIPMFALSTALKVKKELPDAKFYVDELHATARPDPFLFMDYHGERFYLEVWDEPGFNQKRVDA